MVNRFRKDVCSSFEHSIGTQKKLTQAHGLGQSLRSRLHVWLATLTMLLTLLYWPV